MPDLRGDEVLKRLLAIRPDIPVVLSTGFLPQDALQRIPVELLAGILRKPYSLRQMDQVINDALGRSAPVS